VATQLLDISGAAPVLPPGFRAFHRFHHLVGGRIPKSWHPAVSIHHLGLKNVGKYSKSYGLKPYIFQQILFRKSCSFL
jgi:hypothetical protein